MAVWLPLKTLPLLGDEWNRPLWTSGRSKAGLIGFAWFCCHLKKSSESFLGVPEGTKSFSLEPGTQSASAFPQSKRSGRLPRYWVLVSWNWSMRSPECRSPGNWEAWLTLLPNSMNPGFPNRIYSGPLTRASLSVHLRVSSNHVRLMLTVGFYIDRDSLVLIFWSFLCSHWRWQAGRLFCPSLFWAPLFHKTA